MKKALTPADIESIRHLSQSAILCLTDIPKELIKKDATNGKLYLNLSFGISKNKETGELKIAKNGDVCGFISCAPKEEERQEGKNYFIGNTFTGMWIPEGASPESAEAMPTASAEDTDNLPF